MQTGLARFAPAKINLFLEILGRRPDGYHEIDTVMETIAIGDRVMVHPAPELIVNCSRPDVPGGEGNVAFQIVRAAEEVLDRQLPARIEIEKEIPPGSGLGAGSSDAAATLDLVLALHGLAVDAATRRKIAAAVGSDTAFFVDGGLARCTGRGEIIEPLPLKGTRHVVVVLPAAPCPTATVYRHLVVPDAPRDSTPLLRTLGTGGTLAVGLAETRPFNRLAAAAELAFPALSERRAWLQAATGRAPVLSGSGGTFYFLCSSQFEAKRLAAMLGAADPSLDVRRTASYRGAASGAPAPQPNSRTHG